MDDKAKQARRHEKAEKQIPMVQAILLISICSLGRRN